MEAASHAHHYEMPTIHGGPSPRVTAAAAIFGAAVLTPEVVGGDDATAAGHATLSGESHE